MRRTLACRHGLCDGLHQSRAHPGKGWEVTMRIAITGARGRVGSATAAYCRQQGVDVMGTDVIGGGPGVGEFTQFVNADLTDAGQTYDVLDGCDAVIHMAAIA